MKSEREKAKSISITLPGWMLEDLDEAGERLGFSRSMMLRQLIMSCQTDTPGDFATSLVASAIRKAHQSHRAASER